MLGILGNTKWLHLCLIPLLVDTTGKKITYNGNKNKGIGRHYDSFCSAIGRHHHSKKGRFRW